MKRYFFAAFEKVGKFTRFTAPICFAVVVFFAFLTVAVGAADESIYDESFVLTETAGLKTEGLETEGAETEGLKTEGLEDAIVNSASKADAVLAVAERFGISAEDAEKMIDSVLEAGDRRWGENDVWVRFRLAVEENVQFYVMAFVIAAAALSLLWYALSLRLRVASPIRRLEHAVNREGGLSDMLTDCCSRLLEISSQNAASIELYVARSSEKEEELLAKEDELLLKQEELTAKEEELSGIYSSLGSERNRMLLSEIYVLRMLKLICDRTAMPLSDKAAIDLFYARGVGAVRGELGEDALCAAEAALSVLDKDGDGCGE